MTDDPLTPTSPDGHMRPAVAPPYLPLVNSSDEIQFRTGPWSGPAVVLTDEDADGCLGKLPGLLTGRFTLREVVDRFDPNHQPEIRTIIGQLEEEGVIHDATHGTTDRLEGYRSIYPAGNDSERDPSPTILVVGTGAIAPMVAADVATQSSATVSLLDMGETESPSSPLPGSVDSVAGNASLRAEITDADFVVLTTDRPATDLGHRINEIAFDTGTPWISGRVWGVDAQVGPTVIPGRTACYECFDRRARGTMEDDTPFQPGTDGDAISASPTPLQSHARIVAGWVATDLFQLMETGAGVTLGGVIHFDLYRMTVEPNPVLKLPRCPTCGPSGAGSLDVKRFVDYDRLLWDAR